MKNGFQNKKVLQDFTPATLLCKRFPQWTSFATGDEQGNGESRVGRTRRSLYLSSSATITRLFYRNKDLPSLSKSVPAGCLTPSTQRTRYLFI